ncbi:PAS domain-containing protein [Natronosalvus vescus]|uniref:PAS domain-containing protein n=1 Tax=Natronosalvus vescus TaxID=2953881 RepID=UPI00209048F3|nr:PAS domain-containing protein [Natronosalvus vescus]
MTAVETDKHTTGTDTDAAATVLLIGTGDPITTLETALGRTDVLEVQTAETVETAPIGSPAVESVVCVAPESPATALEVLSGVRRQESTLPVVCYTAPQSEALFDAVLEDDWAIQHRPGERDGDRLAARIRRLIDHHRQRTLTRNVLTAFEAVGDGIALVDPDGTVIAVNTNYVRQFAVAREELLGSHWGLPYPDDEVRRLEETALTVAAAGWRWKGTCIGRRGDTTFTSGVSVIGLEDGGFALLLEGDSSNRVPDNIR